MIRLVRPVLHLLLLLGLLAAPTTALAHTRSESHSIWSVEGAAVRVTFTLPDLEAKRLDPSDAPPSDAVLAAYLKAHLTVSAGGRACALSQSPRAVSAAPGYHRFEAAFSCPSDKAVTLGSSVLVAEVPTHVNFAQIQTSDGKFVEQLLTKDQPRLDVSSADGASALSNASFFDYVRMGVMHIFTGVDHQLFLLGLILLSRRLKDLLFVITGFTLGHSLTLALAVTGLLRPHAEYIDALVGLTIALVGAEIIAEATGRPKALAIGSAAFLAILAVASLAGLGGLPALLLIGAALFSGCYLMISGTLRDTARLRLVVTLVFGLVHGFGFAADLLEMKLPPERLAELLVGFNLGVEAGQLCLVIGVSALIALVARTRWKPPQGMVTDLASTFLGAMGLFWFISRSFA